MLNPNYDFIIIGEGKDRWYLQEFLERNKIEKNIKAVKNEKE